MSSKIEYYVNGFKSTVWSRLRTSKTFWVCAVFVLGAAVEWNLGRIGLAALWQICLTGTIGILLRSALAKAELSSAAMNDDINHVTAESVAKSGGPSAGVAIGIAGAIALGGLALTGCVGDKMALSGRMCYTDPATGNQICLGPGLAATIPPPPPPTPPPPEPPTLEK